MNAKDKKKLASIVYEFVEMRTKYNSSADGDLVANKAVELFNDIINYFDIEEELLYEVEYDPYTDEGDKGFLADFLKRK